MIATVFLAWPVTGFTTNRRQHFFRLLYRVAAFFSPTIHVTADAVFVLRIVFVRIQASFDFCFLALACLERFHGVGMRRISPRFGLGFVAGTAFLTPFKIRRYCAREKRK